MRYAKLLACVLAVAFLLAGTFACSNQAAGEIHGSVQKAKSGDGFVIVSEGKTYKVEGQDVSQFHGKMVHVTGTMSKAADGSEVLNVTSVKGD